MPQQPQQPDQNQMYQQFQQILQNPQIMQKLQDPALRMRAAQHLAQQLPAPPDDVMSQMSPPALQQTQQAPAPTSQGLGGMMQPGGPSPTVDPRKQTNPFDGLR